MNCKNLKVGTLLVLGTVTVGFGVTVVLANHAPGKPDRVTPKRVTGLNQLKQPLKMPSPDR